MADLKTLIYWTVVRLNNADEKAWTLKDVCNRVDWHSSDVQRVLDELLTEGKIMRVGKGYRTTVPQARAW